MKKIIAAGMILVSAVLYAGEGTGDCIIKSEGFRSEKGGALLSLYRKGGDMKKDGFLNIKGEIKDGKCVFYIQDLKLGKYAVKIVHDENSNGKIDMGILGTEGVGVSRNIKINKPPKYEETEIEFSNEDKEIFIRVQYPTIFDFIAGGMKHGE